jgi:ParB-like chromosome segregation protein Spo0J
MQEKKQVDKVKLNELNPHEQVIEENLNKVLKSLKIEKRLKEPVVVDEETKVILDGHHRVKAYEILGLREIPCRLVDYSSDKIAVEPHQNGDISKEEVIQKGLRDDLFPPKTSKHRIFQDIENS